MEYVGTWPNCFIYPMFLISMDTREGNQQGRVEQGFPFKGIPYIRSPHNKRPWYVHKGKI